MKIREITLRGRRFRVEECQISKNYSDVTKMFLSLENLKIDEDGIIFDVGANIGIFSLAYSMIYKQTHTYAIEPLPDAYNLLVRNINLNKSLINRVHPFNLGFSNRNCTLELSIPTKLQHRRYDPDFNQINCGLFSIHGKGDKKIKSRFVTLDSFFLTQKIRKVDFIKIDVEGHEYEVLQGAKTIIKRYRPIIYMEYNELTRALSKHDSKAFERFFKKYDYKIYGLEYGWKRKLKYLENLNNLNNVSDLVCVQDMLK